MEIKDMQEPNKQDTGGDKDPVELLQCKICMAKNANHIFKTCGHLVACEDCIKDLKN